MGTNVKTPAIQNYCSRRWWVVGLRTKLFFIIK